MNIINDVRTSVLTVLFLEINVKAAFLFSCHSAEVSLAASRAEEVAAEGVSLSSGTCPLFEVTV